MTESVYKVVELVGSSPTSFEDAVTQVIETAAKSLRDIRVARIREFDVKIDNGKIVAYRARVRLSFKYHQED
jgi:flavin-binding protein dodecin